MSEETIVRQAAPTLAGIKTGSMFPYRFGNREELLEDIRAFNRIFVPRGMCLLLLRVMEKSALLYLYRPQSLERDLKNNISQELLQESGYNCCSGAACVRHLVERFRTEQDFPHEVGLFLSYPPMSRASLTTGTTISLSVFGRSTAMKKKRKGSANSSKNALSVTAASGRTAWVLKSSLSLFEIHSICISFNQIEV